MGDEQDSERIFKVNFGAEGVARLQTAVKEKLKEFMGDYMDDILVEYIVVLLRNGRRKDEARKELDVFLGDDSAEFVLWLWEHLSSNLHLYVQKEESSAGDVSKSTNDLNEPNVKRNLEKDNLAHNRHSESAHETERSSKLSRRWKGSVQEDTEVFPLRSVVSDILHSDERNSRRRTITRRSQSNSRSRSPEPQVHGKRSRDNERPVRKNSVIAAPRRLLQFAVRDAVKTMQQPNSRSEPSLKRLRSVVSTVTSDVQERERQRTRPRSRMLGGLSTALKAAVEAAEDVNKSRTSSSVFDRLSHGRSTAETVDLLSASRTHEQLDMECEDFERNQGRQSGNQHNGDHDEFAGNMTGLEETEVTDSAMITDEYDNYSSVRHEVHDASENRFSADKDNKSVVMDYNVAEKHDDDLRNQRLMDKDLPVSSAPLSVSSKIVNISVNVNTWKPSPHYEAQKDVSAMESSLVVENPDTGGGKLNGGFAKGIDASATHNVKDREVIEIAKESQKLAALPGSHTTGRPMEDFDSRTLIVSNVHFAATKDSLSRHFNKFGDVLKVIIVTDAATGQPTGSAYVEFLKKESADLALALNGTSFMSRIMKVARRSSHEASPALGWSRVSRPPAFASRVSRMPYPRGLFPGPFRGRLAVKPGARSLQWKRGASAAQTIEGTNDPNSLASGSSVSPTSRSLTYSRTERKTDGTAGTS